MVYHHLHSYNTDVLFLRWLHWTGDNPIWVAASLSAIQFASITVSVTSCQRGTFLLIRYLSILYRRWHRVEGLKASSTIFLKTTYLRRSRMRPQPKTHNETRKRSRLLSGKQFRLLSGTHSRWLSRICIPDNHLDCISSNNANRI